MYMNIRNVKKQSLGRKYQDVIIIKKNLGSDFTFLENELFNSFR